MSIDLFKKFFFFPKGDTLNNIQLVIFIPFGKLLINISKFFGRKKTSDCVIKVIFKT